MALDTAATLNAVLALVRALPGVQDVILGAPKVLEQRLSAYVVLGGQHWERKTTGGGIQRVARVLVVLGYRTGGDATAAEGALPAVIDALVRAVSADPTLGGAADTAIVDLSGADAIEYRPYAGLEYRQYPVVIEATQTETVPITAT